MAISDSTNRERFSHISTDAPIGYPEFLLRILFACFYPAVHLAVEAHCSLDTVKDTMTLALWREAKRKHSTINLISLVFAKSSRTVKALSARFNKGQFFGESETSLMRRVDDLLRQRPMTMEELSHHLPRSNEIDCAKLLVEALLREGRIEPTGPEKHPHYRVVKSHSDLVSLDNWERRLDALTEHLEAVTETIRRQFLDKPTDCTAARTFSFKARPEDMMAFREKLFEFVREQYKVLEERAEKSEDARVYSVYAGVTEMKSPVQPSENKKTLR